MQKGMQKLMDGQVYIDLDLLVNGSMDAFLLILTARLLQQPINVKRIAGGVLIGEIPVLLAITPYSFLLNFFKFITPFLMILIAYPFTTLRNYIKRLILFWLLSAGLGGLIFAAWGWLVFNQESRPLLTLGIKNIWVLPIAAILWWGTQHLWQKWQMNNSLLKGTVYDLKMDFKGEGKAIEVKALVDTGNSLQDPLTGAPVILVEENYIIKEMPEEWREFLNEPWSEENDPWPLLWKRNPSLIKHVVFIPFQAIGKKSWLIGFRPKTVICGVGESTQELQATVALVKQVLSPDGLYQALLHPEHVQRGGF